MDLCVQTDICKADCAKFSSRFSYHVAAADIWLKDFVEGALREGTAVKGEDLGHVAQTVFVMPPALHRQRRLGVVGAGFEALCARGVEYAAEL